MNAFVPGNASDLPTSSRRSTPLSATMSATSIVPVQPWMVTASPETPRRSASGAHGERSSHSPTTIPVTRPACPKTLFEDTPTTWPPTLRIRRRVARPIPGPGAAAPRAGAAGATEAADGVGDAEPLAARAVHEQAGDHTGGRRVEGEQVEDRVGHRFG